MLKQVEKFLTSVLKLVTFPIKMGIEGLTAIKNLFVDTTNTINKNANSIINTTGKNVNIMIDKAVKNHGDQVLKYGMEFGKVYTGTKVLDLYKAIQDKPSISPVTPHNK